MKLVIQRVREAAIAVDEQEISRIGKGLLVLIGISANDTKDTVSAFLKKLIGLRIFEDENGKTNLSLQDVDGQLLLVSQFTLYANCRKGNRPSFTEAGSPDMAEELYTYMVEQARKQVEIVQTGIFGADMKVSLVNDGPFTIVLDETSVPAAKSK